MRTLVYLGSPYSHPDPAVRERRFQEVCLAASHLMRAGLHVFSPIAHSHPILLTGDLPTGWEYWEKYDEAVLQGCSSLIVLELEGWEDSRGLRGEIEIARRLRIPKYHTSPDPAALAVLADVVRRDHEEKPAG